MMNEVLASIAIIPAQSPAEIKLIRGLLREYAASVKGDLCFQGFSDELAGLPGAYGPPEGRLLLALAGQTPAGCVAFRPQNSETCEMKRLYVRPSFRGGVGRKLVDRLLEEAAAIGYRRMVLDTLPSMQAAIALYRSMGFTAITPYRENPVPGALFFALEIVKREFPLPSR